MIVNVTAQQIYREGRQTEHSTTYIHKAGRFQQSCKIRKSAIWGSHILSTLIYLFKELNQQFLFFFEYCLLQSIKIIMKIIEYCNIFAIYKAMCSSQQASQGINVKIPLLTLHQIVLQLKMYTIIISTILDSLYLFSRNNPNYCQLTGCYNSMFSIIIICRIRAEGVEFRFK